MKTIKGYPPNIKDIDAVLHVAKNKNIVYTYGSTVYTSDGGSLAPDLEVHESVHVAQQTAMGPTNGGEDT